MFVMLLLFFVQFWCCHLCSIPALVRGTIWVFFLQMLLMFGCSFLITLLVLWLLLIFWWYCLFLGLVVVANAVCGSCLYSTMMLS